MIMFRNYLRIAFRTLLKHKAYSAINIFGLAIGLTACMLIVLYVQNELSYDQFHEHAGQIYLVSLDGAAGGTFFKTVHTPAPLAETLVSDYPEVINSTRLLRSNRALVTYEDVRFYETKFLWADSTIFDVFTFPLIKGDPGSALTQPNTVVISEEIAEKYFAGEDPLGKTIRVDNAAEYRVTGVLADIPETSSLEIDLLASIISLPQSNSPVWINNFLFTYVVLQEGFDAAFLEAKFPVIIKTHVAPQIEQAIGQTYDELIEAGLRWDYFVQPLTKVYLRAETNDSAGVSSDISYVYILIAVALFILLTAAINFMNLSTARSANRAKEVGIRKVMGSSRDALVQQFLGESVATSLLALIVALLSVAALLPLFNNLADKSLSFILVGNPGFLISMVGVTVVIGLIAGIYPAFVLSAFRPVTILKGIVAAGSKKSVMRSTLVVMQFTISIGLLVGTGVVFDQLRYMQEKRLGFNKEQVVVLPIETQQARESYESFRQELLGNPQVVGVAASEGLPGRIRRTNGFLPPDEATSESGYAMAESAVSHDFIETLELELVAGRDFSRDFVTDATHAFVINETAARIMGLDPETAVGKRFTRVGETDRQSTIVGVVKDFHFETLHQTIRPVVLMINPDQYQYAAVRLRPENLSQTLTFLQSKWEAFEPGYPAEYFFLDEDFGRFFEQEVRWVIY